jgi:hypothetical protein
MMKSALPLCVFTLAALATLAAQIPPKVAQGNAVTLKYMGAAGWEITDGTTYILIDPYVSRINGPPPPGGHPVAGDTRPAYGWGAVASPDVAAIDAHIQRADLGARHESWDQARLVSQ